MESEYYLFLIYLCVQLISCKVDILKSLLVLKPFEPIVICQDLLYHIQFQPIVHHKLCIKCGVLDLCAGLNAYKLELNNRFLIQKNRLFLRKIAAGNSNQSKNFTNNRLSLILQCAAIKPCGLFLNQISPSNLSVCYYT